VSLSPPTCPLCQQDGTQKSHPELYSPLKTELQYTPHCRQSYSILHTAEEIQYTPHCRQSSELQYKSSTADRVTVYSTSQTDLRATLQILHCKQSYSKNPSLQTELQYKSSTADRATVQTLHCRQSNGLSPTANRVTVNFLLQTFKSSTADRATVYQGKKYSL
jgi:hypothetical protein